MNVPKLDRRMEECVEIFDREKYMSRKNELMAQGQWFPRYGGIMTLEFGSHVEKTRILKTYHGKKFWQLSFEIGLFLAIDRDLELTERYIKSIVYVMPD
jgi:hypothetical protein